MTEIHLNNGNVVELPKKQKEKKDDLVSSLERLIERVQAGEVTNLIYVYTMEGEDNSDTVIAGGNFRSRIETLGALRYMEGQLV